MRLHDDAWSWYTGALGEIYVGELLKQRGSEWFVRHAVPIGAGTKDVDHLVIGPGGIFAINTKHHAGASVWVGDVTLRVNNSGTRHLNQAVSDGRDVAQRLTSKLGFPVRVHSVLAILNSKLITDKRAADKRLVTVIDAQRLVGWLLARPRQLSDATLGLNRLAAEEPETWHIDPRAADTLRVMHRFERLVALVGTPPAPASQGRTVRSRTRNQAPSHARRTTRSRPAQTRGRKRATVGDLLGLWFAFGLIVTVILVIRGVANQPCTSPLACMFPPMYLVFKPLLQLGAVAALGAGAIGTLIWIVRRVTR